MTESEEEDFDSVVKTMGSQQQVLIGGAFETIIDGKRMRALNILLKGTVSLSLARHHEGFKLMLTHNQVRELLKAINEIDKKLEKIKEVQ